MSDTGATPPAPPQPGPQPGDANVRVIRNVPVEQAPERLLPGNAPTESKTPARGETRAETRAETRTEARVVSQREDGATRLRTADAEEIVIRTRIKLAEGQRVILQLRIAREQAALQAQLKPQPGQPPAQQQPQTPRPVAEADITILRNTTAASAAKAEAAPPPTLAQAVRIAVVQGVSIRAQYIPPLQTAQTAPPPQQAPQQAPVQAQAAAPQPQTAIPQTPLESLQQQAARLLARDGLPLLPQAATPATSPATGNTAQIAQAQATPQILPPGAAALKSLNAFPATLKPLLILLAAQTQGSGNVPLQNILSRPGLPALNIARLPPQAALPLLTGPAALFNLGQQLAAARTNAPGIAAAAAPATPATQPLQALLQQLGIIPAQTGTPTGTQAAPLQSTQPQPLQPQPVLPLAQGPNVPQGTTLQIVQIITPQNIPDNPAVLRSMLSQAPQILTGLVTGPDRAGNPVVATARGQFILTNAQPLAPGTVLSFSITPDAALLKEPEIPLWPLPPLDPVRSERWGAMEEALQVLQADNPTAAQALRNVIPAPIATRFTAATLFFLAALRAGDIGAWMGQQQLQALRESGRSDLINRLHADFGRAATQSADVLTGDWRAIPLPFMHEEQVMKIQMFLRQQRDRDEKGKGSKGKSARQTRFLIEAMLSRLGQMQLDGLFVPAEKRLDLVMRTKEPLPADIRNGMAQRYRDTVSATGLAGDINFQARGKGWVHLGPDERHNGRHGVTA